MTARFVILVLAAVSLAACATASTDDLTSVRRGASPTKGEVGPHKVYVRGPVVPDTAVASHAAPARATLAHRATPAHRSVAAKPAASRYALHEVPNPMRQDAPATAPAPVTTPAPETATVPATPVTNLPSEPAQTTSFTDQPVQTAPVSPQTAIGDVPIQEAAPTTSTDGGIIAPALLGLSNITPDSIEQMFGGMPFWLISVIAAALVATFGLALRRPADKDEGYEQPNTHHDHDDEDYREPYAA